MSIKPKTVLPKPETPHFDTSSLFWESRLKLFRARHHLYHASDVFEGVLELDGHMFGFIRHPRTGMSELLHPHFSHPGVVLPLSDCVRNLRSALDYLVSALARSVGLPDNDTIFPNDEKEEGVKGRFPDSGGGKKSKRAKPIDALSGHYPNLSKIVLDDIKPWSAEYGAPARGDLIWRIIKTDNADKHRLLIPVLHHSLVNSASYHFIGQGPFTGSSGTLELTGFGLSGSRPIISIAGRVTQSAEPDATVDLIFPEESYFAGKPVLITLADACAAVDGVIELFETRFQNPAR